MDISLLEEIWAPVNFRGFEHVEASSYGRIRSKERIVSFTRLGVTRSTVIPSRIHSFHVTKRGRVMVCLNEGARSITTSASRIICEAFHGPPPDGHECAHLDGDTLNNQPSNLAWVTHAENEAHKARHGTKLVGETHHQAKLREHDVLAARARYRAGESVPEIAASTGLPLPALCKAVAGKTWRHLALAQPCTRVSQ